MSDRLKDIAVYIAAVIAVLLLVAAIVSSHHRHNRHVDDTPMTPEERALYRNGNVRYLRQAIERGNVDIETGRIGARPQGVQDVDESRQPDNKGCVSSGSR